MKIITHAPSTPGRLDKAEGRRPHPKQWHLCGPVDKNPAA